MGDYRQQPLGLLQGRGPMCKVGKYFTETSGNVNSLSFQISAMGIGIASCSGIPSRGIIGHLVRVKLSLSVD